MTVVQEKSSTGLDANLAGLLTYAAGFITGVVFLVLEKDSKFVRFHAMQSVMTFIGLFILNIAFTIVGFIPFFGWIISLFGLFLIPLGFILWGVLMFKAYQGEWFKLPIVGDMAMKQVGGDVIV